MFTFATGSKKYSDYLIGKKAFAIISRWTKMPRKQFGNKNALK